MTVTLVFSVIFITLALVCYSIGVWGEKFAGILKGWHLVFFWIGFIFDTTGTTLMSAMAKSFTFNIHGITGVVAILLMAFHAVWATVVLIKRDERRLRTFHRFSIVVWFIWLVPFFTGMFLNMF